MKILEKFTRKTIDTVNDIVKEDTAKKIDNIMPTIIAVASIVLAALCTTSPDTKQKKPNFSTITIHNYYGPVYK